MMRIRAVLVRGNEERISDILTMSDRFVDVIDRFREDHPGWRVTETWEVPITDVWVEGMTGVAA